jgi:hypothetical protein
MSAIRVLLLCAFWFGMFFVLCHTGISFFMVSKIKETAINTTEPVFTEPMAFWDTNTIKEFFNATSVLVIRRPDVITIRVVRDNLTGSTGAASFVSSGDDEMSGQSDIQSAFSIVFELFIYPETTVSNHTCIFKNQGITLFLCGVFDGWAVLIGVAFYVKNRKTFTERTSFLMALCVDLFLAVECVASLITLASLPQDACRDSAQELLDLLNVVIFIEILYILVITLMITTAGLFSLFDRCFSNKSSIHRLDGVRTVPPSGNDIAVVMNDYDDVPVLVEDSPV